MDLITGAAGFIGHHLALRLAGDGVLGLDNLNDAYPVRMKHHRLERILDAGVDVRTSDVRDEVALDEAFRAAAPERVFHLAARAGVRASVTNPLEYLSTNAEGTLRVLEACRRHDVDHLVLASTSSAYGAADHVPFSETDAADRPLSPYAATKLAAEHLAHSYHHLHGIHVSVLRFFTVYGPAGRPDMVVFRFVRDVLEGRPLTLYGDGTQERDFTYVDDVVEAVERASRLDGFHLLNVGNDQPRSVNDLIGIVEEATGRRAQVRTEPPHPADVPRTWADLTRTRATLRWAPSTSLEDGVARSTAWYQENRAWARDL